MELFNDKLSKNTWQNVCNQPLKTWCFQTHFFFTKKTCTLPCSMRPRCRKTSFCITICLNLQYTWLTNCIIIFRVELWIMINGLWQIHMDIRSNIITLKHCCMLHAIHNFYYSDQIVNRTYETKCRTYITEIDKMI